METKANYVVIGAFTLTIAIAAVLFGLFAARYATDSAWNRFQIIFNESVIGLSDGSPVLYNGVSIGRVTEPNSTSTQMTFARSWPRSRSRPRCRYTKTPWRQFA